MDELQSARSRERVGLLFGHPIAHSLSPLLHQTVYDNVGLNWAQIPVDSTDMNLFLSLIKDPKFYGASVTMPHKLAILPKLDDLTPEARDVGACNTIFVRQDSNGSRRYIGTNTDVIGIKQAFYQNVSNPDAIFHDRPALVIGGGGAARSAVYALRTWMRATSVYLVNRDKSEVDAVIAECKARGYGDGLRHVESVEDAESLEGPGAIVACVPDFPPRTEAEKEARAVIQCFLGKSHKGAMLEMCYHPSPWTALVALAETERWQVILGTEAMIWQGIEQDRFWTGRDIKELPVQKVQEVIQRQLSKSKI